MQNGASMGGGNKIKVLSKRKVNYAKGYKM